TGRSETDVIVDAIALIPGCAENIPITQTMAEFEKTGSPELDV
ncbi:MAG: DNA-binding domain-containing protein, partial [Moorea sp. SIO3I7]|nr:DNA-binding domain-containing protein [Moorena sp. SIO3I7]